MKRRKRILVNAAGLLALFLIIIGILAVFPSNYYLVSPGTAEPIAPMLTVEEAPSFPVGEIMLTTVSMRNASLLDYLYVQLVRPELLELRSKDLLPEDMDMEKYFEHMQEVMEESQMKAKVVALRQAGYEAEITGEGAEIAQILEGSNAHGVLEVGDVITAIDGHRVGLLTEVIDKVRDREVGDPVEVTIKRGEAEKTFSIKTTTIQDETTRPSIGVGIIPYNRDYKLPLEVKVDAGQIGGPSAGSMFTLGIYNQLLEEDITSDRKLAGTGTINLDQEVGRIEGVKQKVVSARESGIDIFFVPAENMAAAQEVETGELELVEVKSFTDILNYLQNL